MYLDFTKKLDFQVQDASISAQKINSSKLDIFGMVIASFSIKNYKKMYDFLKKLFY